MTLQELYRICDNLDHNTWFEVRSADGSLLASGPYSKVFLRYGDTRIKGFKIWDCGICTVYV